jgi:thioredoxin reductase
MSRSFDVAIVGGGPAGLAAALILGRMRRRVLLLDADDPAHAPSEGVHGLFGHDGTPPLELRRIGREQLQPYDGVTVRMVAAEEVRQASNGFSVLADGEEITAGVLLLATGLRYELPPVEGATEVWARGVFHCPYCHGWEVQDRPLAAYGADAAGLALLLTSLSDDVVLLTDGDASLEPDDAGRLESAGVAIREDSIARVEAEDGRLARIRFADGSSEDRAGLFFVPRFVPSPLPAQLGCELDDDGMMVIDEDGRTSVPGVFGAGDATVGKAAVVLAAAAGSRAAYAINAGLAQGTLPAQTEDRVEARLR